MGGTSPAKKEAPAPELKKVKEAVVHRVTADDMAKKQREISVSEFFAKNRHLLGFDSPRKALLTAVKEAVDNSLDACEEARILPEIEVKIEVVGGLKAPEPKAEEKEKPKAEAKEGEKAPAEGPKTPSVAQAERFIVTVTDNGPGIVADQIPRVFAKLLYGSKFHRLRMSRGQQGIGISAAGLYGQLTTGKPVRVTSKAHEKKPARYVEIVIDTAKNEPRVLANREATDWAAEHTGTRVAIEHARIIYVNPEGQKLVFERMVDELPASPREIKPHPYGIELGVLLKMLQDTKSHWVGGFLSSDFSRVSTQTASEICKKAGIDPKMLVRKIHGDTAEKLYKAIQQTPIMNPPTDCLSPIGEKAILAGLYKQIKGDFYTAVSRKPAVYRGNPFAIEVGLAFGTGQAGMVQSVVEAEEKGPLAEGEEDEKAGEVQMARVMRFANRVPLLYQPGACAVTKSVVETSWRNYGLSQSRGALPQGPIVIFVHMASVWVPFTSESKEAVADYDEIRKEIRLALNEAGRRLSTFIRKRERAALELKRRDVFEAYIEEVAEACKRLKKGKLDAEDLKKRLTRIAKDVTGGDKTDEILKKKGQEEEPAGESTIIITPEGAQGAVPTAANAEKVHDAAPTVAEVTKEEKTKTAKPAKKEKGNGKGKR